MTRQHTPDRAEFVRTANEKQAAYGEQRKRHSEQVLAVNRARFGAGIVR